MKRKLGTLLILVLTLSMLSFSVFAINDNTVGDTNNQIGAANDSQNFGGAEAPAQNAPAQNAPAQNAPAQNVPAQNAPAQNAPAQNAPAQNVPAQDTTASIVVAADNVSWDNCVILNEAFAKECINSIEKATEYPRVIDLSALGSNIDSIVIPSELLEAVLTPIKAVEPATTQQPQPQAPATSAGAPDPANSQGTTTVPGTTTAQGTTTTPEATNAPSEDDKNEFVLQLIFKDKECLWKRGTLEGLATDAKTVTLKLVNADKETLQPAEEKGSAEVDFDPKDGKTYGVLFVSKDADGNWDSTGTFLFDSVMMYVLSKILLVVITFAVIICFNLLIIKLYRLKK